MRKVVLIFINIVVLNCIVSAKIDREKLVNRNSPINNQIDSLSSLSVGNGEFAYTVDITGLQTFPEKYKQGVPLGTQAQWGWHSFPNIENFEFQETLKNYDFRGRNEPYAVQMKEGRAKNASEYFRVNPHRLHLGNIGFDISSANEIDDIYQRLNLWKGVIESDFTYKNNRVFVKTACHPEIDQLGFQIHAEKIPDLLFKFPYPTGAHADDASNCNLPQKHHSSIIEKGEQYVIIERILDESKYFIRIEWEGEAVFTSDDNHLFRLKVKDKNVNLSVRFDLQPISNQSLHDVFDASEMYWMKFWKEGAAVDFSACKDVRAKELERRVVLSQYLLAIQSAGSTPPQETGLTYNSWYGKFHLEMIWWHQAHFALWNRSELLEKTLDWYFKAYPKAKEIAQRQGFDGVRWMKMTDPSGNEAPSNVGSFLIWQQPHLIYLAELVYRANPNDVFLNKYADLIDETARFIYSFADYDMLEGRYILKGIIPAQETLRASETINPPFELSYWYFAMQTAQKWRERLGKRRNLQWDEMIDKLSPLAYKNKLYLAAETAEDTYEDIRFTSDHMAVLGAWGILPGSPLVRKDYMQNTLNWIWDNWNWGRTWGWDYPMTAMCAARIGDPEKAVNSLLMEKRTNTYLTNGHNYQDTRLRVYLPGNGGLLTAVGMMCAGWDGNKIKNPGFPKDGKWNVAWEGLLPMP